MVKKDKILLVEDDPSLARGIEFALKKEGWQISLASTFQMGYDLFQSERFVLILLDVMLPDGSGLELCQKIRRESDVPIIFLTACDEEVNIVQGLELGGDDYITKPFRVRELISRMKAVLRRTKREEQNEEVLRSGQILLKPLAQKAYKNGEELLLTPIEMKLLTVFIQYPNQVLTRTQILEQIWDVDGNYIDDNTLSVHIRRLREKIEGDPSKPEYIRTVRGFGYQWDQRSS